GDPEPARVAVEPQQLEPDVEHALRSLIETVTAVHSAERPPDVVVEPRPGVVVERRWLPLDSVGIYVPAGRFPLPSSLVMAAGPGEGPVIADETAAPALCLVDLRAQAEHGPDSEAVLVTTSPDLAAAVDWPHVELVANIDEAIAYANDYAPEHLQLHVADPDALAARVRNAGAVFLGEQTSSVVGDYYAGSNHVLPTGGLARSLGGLGLEAF